MFTAKDAYGIDFDRSNDAQTFLVDAIREYASKSEDISRKAASIRSTLDRVDEYLEAEYQLNSLGELQSTPRDFDRLCGERYAAGQNVSKLAWQLVRVGAMTEAEMDSILNQTPFARKGE